MKRASSDELGRRLRSQFERRGTFERASFLAVLSGIRGNMQTGVLDVTFSVGPGEKDAAFGVTDAPGEQLLITVERISLKGSADDSLHATQDRDQGAMGGRQLRRASSDPR